MIKITNFDDGETVTYPLIKLVGTSPPCPCTNNVSPEVTINFNESTSSTKIHDGKFKILLQLVEGSNVFEIKECCKSTKMTMHYHPRHEADHVVLPVYIIFKNCDRFQAPKLENSTPESACKRIDLALKLIQCVTAEKLFEQNLARKTFHIAENCCILQSDFNVEEIYKMTPKQLFRNLSEEILFKVPKDVQKNYKFVAFLSCTKYFGDQYEDWMTFDDLLKITKAYVALGCGDVALFGTANLFTWPEKFEDVIPKFLDSTPVDKKELLDDSCFRGTYGTCFATTLGAVMHELFHAFDLGHTESGIMGRGFDNIHKFFTEIDWDFQTTLERIEFKEEFEALRLSERLEKEHQNKGMEIRKKYREFDDVTLSKSCAILLYYHKWFNDARTTKNAILSFDPVSRFIKSTCGIAVVELRENHGEMVKDYWLFEGKILKFGFQLPEVVKNKYLLVVEDKLGNTIKEFL